MPSTLCRQEGDVLRNEPDAHAEYALAWTCDLAASRHGKEYWVHQHVWGLGLLLWYTSTVLPTSPCLNQQPRRPLPHPPPSPTYRSAAPQARVIAALVPALNLVRLALVGSGVVSDPGLVKSTSRSGERGELLRGPLIYVVVLGAVTLAFWRESPVGIIRCGGAGAPGGGGGRQAVGRL